MFKSFVFLGLVTVLLCGSASAQYGGIQNKQFGLGIILGEPTGLSGKVWTGEKTAVDGAIAWSTGVHNHVNLHFDYLIHNFSVLNQDGKKIILYYGVGTKFKFSNDNDKETRVGIRVPLGVSYIFPTASVDIFAEIVPVLDLIPDSDFELNGGVGVRYYF